MGTTIAMRLRNRVFPWKVAHTLLAPVLCVAAIGLHYLLNVPTEAVIATNKRKAAEEREASHRPRKPPPVQPPAKTPARSDAELEALRGRFANTPFDDEPRLATWSRESQTLMSRAVLVARKRAFAGDPEEPRVAIRTSSCRTIRCRITLHSPYRHELDLMRESLQTVRTGDGALWSSFDAKLLPPKTLPDGKIEEILEVTVSLAADGIKPTTLETDSADSPPTPSRIERPKAPRPDSPPP